MPPPPLFSCIFKKGLCNQHILSCEALHFSYRMLLECCKQHLGWHDFFVGMEGDGREGIGHVCSYCNVFGLFLVFLDLPQSVIQTFIPHPLFLMTDCMQCFEAKQLIVWILESNDNWTQRFCLQVLLTMTINPNLKLTHLCWTSSVSQQFCTIIIIDIQL